MQFGSSTVAFRSCEKCEGERTLTAHTENQLSSPTSSSATTSAFTTTVPTATLIDFSVGVAVFSVGNLGFVLDPFSLTFHHMVGVHLSLFRRPKLFVIGQQRRFQVFRGSLQR